MTTVDAPQVSVADSQELRDEWLGRLDRLTQSVQGWAEELGWSTRRIDKRMEDSQLGTYQAPALLLQAEFVRLLLEPIARFAPGTEGVVDLYQMPAYDDIASLFFCDGEWRVYFVFPGSSAIFTKEVATSPPLSRETIQKVLEHMRQHGA